MRSWGPVKKVGARRTAGIAGLGGLVLLGALVLLSSFAPMVLGLTSPTSSASLLSQATSPTPRSACSNCTWTNYTTNPADVVLVASSPNGAYVAAATNDRRVFVFSTNPSLPAPLGTYTLPTGAGATTLALSDTSATGSPLVLVGWAGPGAGSTGLSAWNITTSGVFTGSPAWSLNAGSFVLPHSSLAWIRQAVISDDGSVVMVMTGFSFSGSSGTNISYFAHGQTSCGTSSPLQYCWGMNFSTDRPVSLSMSVDGTRAVAAVQGSLPELLIFDAFGQTGIWTAPAGGEMYTGAISGNGLMMYMSTSADFYIGNANTGNTNKTIPTSALNTPTQISPSFDGTTFLVSSQIPSQASYYRWSTGTNWSSLWTLSFPAATPIDNATLSLYDPSYFVISSVSTAQMFYYYPGMPESTSSAYRTISTVGPLRDLAVSSHRGTLVMGSGYITGGKDEFTLVTDGGIPTPAAPIVVMQAVSPSPGDTSASLQISWTNPGNVPITGTIVAFELTPGQSTSGSLPATKSFVGTGSSPLTVSGFSFGTNYTVTITVQAFGGASSATSTPVARSTDNAPAVVDPFLGPEIAAAVLLVVGLLAFVLFRRRGTVPKELQGAGAPPSNYPSGPTPPQGGGAGR